ncbi:MAG: hypothetical protein JWN29_3419, partial [Acidimicrobiales bacterium]|nr:hypothetical protein [Acidimicrobiales bacterium]
GPVRGVSAAGPLTQVPLRGSAATFRELCAAGVHAKVKRFFANVGCCPQVVPT